MSTGGDRAPSAPSWAAEPAIHQQTVPSPDTATRGGAIALLRLAGLDAELDRLRQSVSGILELLGRLRSDLATLDELIEKDRPQGIPQESGELLDARRRRLLRIQRTQAELAKALNRDEAEVLAMSCMSCELQRKAARLAEERDAALARVSASLRERYETAVRKGQQPALVGVQDGRCSACGETLAGASRRLGEASLRVVPCSGCLRLVYDCGSTARALMRSTLRPVTGAKP